MTAPEPKLHDHKYDDFAVDRAVEVLMQAEDFKKDPKMMKLVHAKLDKKTRAISSIKDLRDVKAQMDEQGETEPDEDDEE
jgi:hypothetical protein